MKKIINAAFFVVLLCSGLSAKAQQSIRPFISADTSVLKLSKPKLTLLYKKNHFNIYKATPDNMYVVKPDSSISFNMPVKKFGIIQTPITPQKPNRK